MTQLENRRVPVGPDHTAEPNGEHPAGTRPQPADDGALAGIEPAVGRGRLQETSAGWVLTLSLDARAAARFDAGAAAGSGRVDLGALELTVAPNLVPGGPFRVDRVEVELTNDIQDGA